MRAVGLLLIILSLPVLIAWLRGNPGQRKWAYLGVGLLPFVMGALNLDAAFVNWAGWPGYAKGIILSLLDTLAFALLVTSKAPLRKLPFTGVFIGYILAVLLSVFMSTLPMSSTFYFFQLLRIFLVFAAVASFAGRPDAMRWLCFGLALGAIFQAVVAVDQRLSGVVQASGTMGHQNLLGLMLHFVTLPLLALLLAGERSKLIMAGVLAGLVAVALGASRGTIVFVGLGTVLLVFLSLVRRSTAHKWKIAGLGILVAAVVVPIAATSFHERFAARPIFDAVDAERLAFEQAAKAMWADHPMGVGANQYVVIANAQGYSDRAGVTWIRASRATNVHNLYLLTGAETGWVGLIALVTLLIYPILRGMVFAFRNRGDPRGDVVLGASVTLVVVCLHSFYEWVFVSAHTQYVFAIGLGLIAGCIRQVEYERRANARSRAAARASAAILPA